MRGAKDPHRGNERNYIPNDEIDREEKADIRQQKKGSAFSVLLGGLIVISLIAFIFVLLDSGILSGSGTQTVYGTPQLTQEEKKAAEGFMALMALMVFVMFNDISRLFS